MDLTPDEELALAVERMKARRRVLMVLGGVLSIAMFLLAGYLLVREIRQDQQRVAVARLAEEQQETARSRPAQGREIEVVPTFAQQVRGSLEQSRQAAGNTASSAADDAGSTPADNGGPDDHDEAATGVGAGADAATEPDDGTGQGGGDETFQDGDPAERPVTLPRMLRDMDPESPEAANAAQRAGIQATLDAIRSITEPEERLPWVRLPEQIGAQFLSYHERDQRGIVISELGEVRAIEMDGRQFAVVDAATEDGQRLQAVFEQVDDRYLLDWESLAHYDPVSWQAFRQPDGPQVAEFRVMATLSESFAGVFSDVNYVSVKLEHPRERGVLFGYFRRNDPGFSDIVEQLERSGESPLPLLLRLAVPDVQARTNQVLIEAVLGYGWIRL